MARLTLPEDLAESRNTWLALVSEEGPCPLDTGLLLSCLVRLSEIHTAGEVFTLDSDFRIDRRHGNKVIPVLMPD